MQLEFAGQEIREKRAAPRRNAGNLQRFPFSRVLTRPWKFRLPEAKERATGKDQGEECLLFHKAENSACSSQPEENTCNSWN